MNENLILKSRDHLAKALQTAGQLNTGDSDVMEAKRCIQRAMKKLGEAAERQSGRRVTGENLSQNWWNGVVAGTTNAMLSPESAVKNIAQLNRLVGAEQKKIDEIETAVQQSTQTILNE